MDTDGGDDDGGYGGGAAYDDDDYQAGGGDGYDDDDAHVPSPSPAKQPSPVKAKSKAATKDSKRRVSFGDGTKDVDPSSSRKIGRGKQATRTPESAHSTTTTPESTGSVATVRTNISTPGSHEFTRGRQIPDESFRNDDDDDDDDDDTDEETNHIDDSFIQKAVKAKSKKRYLDDDDEDDDDAGDDGPPGVRRSRRATKGQKFEYWKGERTVYQAGKLVGVLHALPTPAKSKPKAKAKPKAKSNGQSQKGVKRAAASDDDDEEAEFESSPNKRGRGGKEPTFKVPSGLKLIPRETGDELSVWDDSSDKVKTMKTVCYTESLRPPSELPITAIRPPGKDKVGFAAQSFNIPEIPSVMSSWISGFVELPGGAIKDAEGVGECAQVFFISDCQDGTGTSIALYSLSLSLSLSSFSSLTRVMPYPYPYPYPPPFTQSSWA
jgi:hypothetical protein